MSGHRQAAAALYSLDDKDQHAILAQLPAGDQEILRSLLAELAELGFDKAANSGAVTPAPRTAAAGPQAVDARRVIKRASAEAMLAVLRHEPLSVQACFLQLERWPWANAYLEQLAPARRTQLRDAMQVSIAAAPARDRFLLDAVATALADMLGSAAPMAGGWLSTTFVRLVPWTR